MKRYSLLILLITGFPALSPGWSAEGHRIVGEIASRHLTPKAEAEVARLLNDKSLAKVSTWADRVKHDPEYAWSYSLHYANVGSGAKRFELGRDCPAGDCIVGAVNRYVEILDRSGADDDAREEALKFLVHFVGDIHQPLHLGRPEDRGGTDIYVQFFGRDTSLHGLWDGGFLYRRGKNWRVTANELNGKLSSTQRDMWDSANPSLWATESLRLTRTHAYVRLGEAHFYRQQQAGPKKTRHSTGIVQIASGDMLGEPYYQRNISVVEERLLQAGVRLASILNQAFDKAPAP